MHSVRISHFYLLSECVRTCEQPLAVGSSSGSVWETVVIITFPFGSLVDSSSSAGKHHLQAFISLTASLVLCRLPFWSSLPLLFSTAMPMLESVCLICRCIVGVCRSDCCTVSMQVGRSEELDFTVEAYGGGGDTLQQNMKFTLNAVNIFWPMKLQHQH